MTATVTPPPVATPPARHSFSRPPQGFEDEGFAADIHPFEDPAPRPEPLATTRTRAKLAAVVVAIVVTLGLGAAVAAVLTMGSPPTVADNVAPVDAVPVGL